MENLLSPKGGTGLPKPKAKRKCPGCGKAFKAMTEAQWRNVLYMHREFSIKHRQRGGSR